MITSKYSMKTKYVAIVETILLLVRYLVPLKFTLANKGLLEEIVACMRCGYFILNQTDNDPAYDPPNDIHLAVNGIYNKFCQIG
jgi:hypothetical protein